MRGQAGGLVSPRLRIVISEPENARDGALSELPHLLRINYRKKAIGSL